MGHLISLQKHSALLALIIMGPGCAHQAPQPSTRVSANPLVGAWEMQAVHWHNGDDVYSLEPAQPGIFIFTESRYSIMWVPQDKARTPFEVLSKPTEEEAIAGFRSVVFNGGSYEYSDSTVTSTAFIAKVPGFEGGMQFYRYDINDNILRLTMFDETYPDGTKPEWAGEYETEFVLKRAD